jgi:hypothetical protein
MACRKSKRFFEIKRKKFRTKTRLSVGYAFAGKSSSNPKKIESFPPVLPGCSLASVRAHSGETADFNSSNLNRYPDADYAKRRSLWAQRAIRQPGKHAPNPTA